MIYRCSIVVNLLLILSLAGAAQKIVVSGVVYGEGAGLKGATVALSSFKNKTDSAGRFEIELNPGKAVLHISMIGYETHHESIMVAGGMKELFIELQPHASSLSEVVVTGTTKPVQRLESPIAVEVYTPQFLRKNPSPSIFESLQNVNGVRPQINCSVCNTGDIHINGLEGPYTMVTIDGMPIVSSLSSVYGLFGIPSQLIERIEIVKGPASGLYGSEAIGGLINIITKSPDKAPLFASNIMSTSWQEHNIDLGLRWKVNKKINSLIGINYFNYQKPVDKNGDSFTDVTLQHRISVFNKWSWQRPFERQATFAGRFFYEDRWGGDVRWNKNFRGGDSLYGESIYTKRWEAIGNYQLPLQEKIFLSASATSHDQNSYYGTTPYMARQNIVFGQLKWDKDLSPSHAFIAGLAGRYNYYDDNSTATKDTLSLANKPEKTFVPGIFLQDEWRLSSRHQLLLGIRYDHHPVHKAILTPRLAYKWSINDKQVIRLNAGTGFRVVNLFTEDHAALTGARAVQIIEKLKPEKSYNVNINYLRKLGGPSQNLTVDASVWYTYFHNQIIADYETDPNGIIYDNLKGHAVSRGFTLNLEGSYRQRLKGMAGITLQDVAKIEADGSGKTIRQRPLLTESWNGTWSVSYSFPIAGLTIDYTGNIYGPMQLPLISSLDPRRKKSLVWSIQNIQLTKWISKEVEVYGGVKNHLNWTPAGNNPFLIARTHDPFDKKLDYNGDGKPDLDTDGYPVKTGENPYRLTFDPSYVYAPNQGLRFFGGFRFTIRD
jgi:outer membrane receptor for ferrienterochelin and colicins